ncbi:hypothetical protein NE857_21920 [Nocardiopsis exhalans]|uniref:Uncharacterized protein n=1 Tax=Nocardiopsis exhalans TaxID=163604 RepID=A0ABY5D2J5_9ACTN|nr:hypothetical protein [Nocardiopsis exhalans]USY17976.1 hypothetical protein NE857_21920 [Nocardiopsis exhalans]
MVRVSGALLLLLAQLGALVLVVLRACWPSQSAHRTKLLQTLLRRRNIP